MRRIAREMVEMALTSTSFAAMFENSLRCLPDRPMETSQPIAYNSNEEPINELQTSLSWAFIRLQV
jgi:hypothetical protein